MSICFQLLFFLSTIWAHLAQHFTATEVGEGMMTFTQSERTPWKINMEPIKSPMKRKEHDLKQTSMIVFHVNLQWCSLGFVFVGEYFNACYHSKSPSFTTSWENMLFTFYKHLKHI